MGELGSREGLGPAAWREVRGKGQPGRYFLWGNLARRAPGTGAGVGVSLSYTLLGSFQPLAV